jgi:DNA-binding transcriptional regulator YhcF (GntR family)
MGRKKTNKIDFTFLPFPVDVMGSKAWELLTNAARVAYLHIRERWWFDRQKPVSVTYTAMERFMERNTFSEALKQLESIGFIEKTQTGGLFRKRNYFVMSEEWRRIGREESEKKNHTDGISIKGSQMHTVENGKSASTGSQMYTVGFSRSV